MTTFLFPTELEAHTFRTAMPHCTVAICGVGMAEAAAFTAHYIATNSVDRIVLCGIAGRYPTSPLELLEVVEVASERIEELPQRFKIEYNIEPYFGIKGATSNSVNSYYSAVCECDIENMEGAAIAAICQRSGVAFSEIRSISNTVGASKREWRIEEAIERLTNVLTEIITD